MEFDINWRKERQTTYFSGYVVMPNNREDIYRGAEVDLLPELVCEGCDSEA